MKEKTSAPPSTLQFFSWDRKNGAADATITGAGQNYQELRQKPRWFQVVKLASGAFTFISAWIDTTTTSYTKKTAIYTGLSTDVFKTVSKNYKCAVIYDGTNL